MILQTGMRTDIPAFYSSWFINRIKDGYVLVRNPYNPLQVTRYEISPEVVDLICFCTKNPHPMLSKMEYLKGFGMFWYVTITCYGNDLEPNVPDKSEVIADFKFLSEYVGKSSIGWRYDPIIIDDKYTVEYHLNAFKKIATSLQGYTDTCVISFVDIYPKVKKNASYIRPVKKEEQLFLGKTMIEIASQNGMTVRPCGEGNFLSEFGADCNGCMTKEIYERAIGAKLIIPKTRELRKECSCQMGIDIGAYNSCMHLCKYCYANYDAETVRTNFTQHDEKSPFLIGRSIEGETVHFARQKSWIDNQVCFDFV